MIKFHCDAMYFEKTEIYPNTWDHKNITQIIQKDRQKGDLIPQYSFKKIILRRHTVGKKSI